MIKLNNLNAIENVVIADSNNDDLYTINVFEAEYCVEEPTFSFVKTMGLSPYIKVAFLKDTDRVLSNDKIPATIIHEFNSNDKLFKRFCRDSVPCIIINEIKFWWCDEYLSIVCFLTDDPINDVYIIHPNDLRKLK